MTPFVHGIIFTPDFNPGLRLEIAGLDISKMAKAPVYWGSDVGEFSSVVGMIHEVRLVLSPADCRNDADRGLLDLARGQPFARATAGIFDGEVITLAQEKLLVWSGIGVCLEKNGDTIARAEGRSIGTQAHGGYRVFPGMG